MKAMLRPAAEKDWTESWRLPAAWKAEKGVVAGKGLGALEFKEPVSGDFSLSFKCSTEEKANVEAVLKDKSGKALFTFAFLGRYHSAPVVDGVKCCILKDEAFVKVDPKTWIYPGHLFTLEVRRHRNQ